MTDEDFDALLTPRPPAADPAPRDALLRRTLRVVRRRAWARRAAVAAAVGVAFAAGWLVKPMPPTPELPPVPPAEVVYVPVPVPFPVLVEAPPSGPIAMTAAELELEAEKAADRAASADLFRRAGDKYLADLNDIPAAVRCYRNHLSDAGKPGRNVTADDSWLLIRLKTAIPKEADS